MNSVAKQIKLSVPPPLAIRESAPDALITLATIFGVETPSLKGASVVEVGCGLGTNIIPLAARYPDARFIGYDENADALVEARTVVGLLKLKNISFESALVPAATAKADYIIAHTIFSRFTTEQQQQFLKWVEKSLSPQGLLFLSYQTLPGWYTNEGLRKALQLHVGGIESEQERATQARLFLDFMVQALGTREDPYALLVKHHHKRARLLGDQLFYHEFLQSHATPRFFHEVCGMADSYGLRFLGESNFAAMHAVDLPPQVLEQLRALTKGIVVMEQYLDFIRNRAFRQSVYCRRDVKPQRSIDGARIIDLYFATAFRRPEELDMAEGVEVAFAHPAGTEVRVSGEIIKRVLAAVAAAWPEWRSVSQLEHEVRRAAAGKTIAKEEICNALLEGYRQGVFEAHAEAPRYTITAPARPQVWPVARVQASRYQAVANLRHESVVVPDSIRPLFPYMDGTRDERAIALEIEKLIAAGTLVERDDRPDDAKEKLVKQAIQFAAMNALLVSA